MKTVQVVIRGRVQGVGFRAALRDQAVAAGLAGWCRNGADDEVVAVLSGRVEAVDRVVQWCHHGPAWAAVESVEVSVGADAPADDSFRILR